MAITITPEQAAEKLSRRLKGATEDIRRGVQSVTVAPTKIAATKQEKWLNGIQAAANSGKWSRSLNAVSLEDWQNAMLNKGIGRIGAGVDAAQDKIVAFFEQLLPYQARLQTEVNRMPDITLEDNINRMTAFVRGMANFQKE